MNKPLHTLDDIKDLVKRRWISFLCLYVKNVENENAIVLIEALRFKNFVKKITNSEVLKIIIANSKLKIGYGYSCCIKNAPQTKQNYLASLNEIYFETVVDYLRFLDKQTIFDRFIQNHQMIVKAFPQLEIWACSNSGVRTLLKHDLEWKKIIAILNFIYNCEQLNQYYLRTLPIAVDTKFLEKRKSLFKTLLTLLKPDYYDTTIQEIDSFLGLKKVKKPDVYIRYLDDDCRPPHGFSSASFHITDLDPIHFEVDRVFIVENLTSMVVFPPIPKSLILFGNGYSASKILAGLPFIHHKQIFYWGDMDVDGLYILSDVNKVVKVTPMLMSEKYKHFFFNATEITQQSPERRIEDLCLEDEQIQTYQYLVRNGLRYEQEQVKQEQLFQYLREELLLDNF